MSETQQTRTAERDGCTCPAWVGRCVHFEGQVLFIHIGTGTPYATVCLCDLPVINRHAILWYGHPDEVAVAFEAEERRLLGREG